MFEPRRDEPKVEVIDTSAQSWLLPTKQAGFIDVWGGAYDGADQGMRVLWERLRDAWLRTKESRSGSNHTRRSYESATLDWFEFLSTLIADGRSVRPWEATTDHVRMWQEHLTGRGLAGSSVNQRLAACSSFYSFVIHERGLVNGVEVTAFMDARGTTRQNPFAGSNVQRARTKQYGHARILTEHETYKLLKYLESRAHTLTGCRNQALLLTYLLTGYRNNEVVSMRWGNIRQNKNQPGMLIFEWKGKGGKEQSDPLPMRVYQAIVAYLKASGRAPETLAQDEYIFKPMIIHNMKNLRNAKLDEEASADGHLSTRSAERILHTCLKHAGVERPTEVRVHDLRHTFAHRFRRKRPDLEALRERLHHESLATTGIYAREVLDDPVDDWSEGLYQGLLGL